MDSKWVRDESGSAVPDVVVAILVHHESLREVTVIVQPLAVLNLCNLVGLHKMFDRFGLYPELSEPSLKISHIGQ